MTSGHVAEGRLPGRTQAGHAEAVFTRDGISRGWAATFLAAFALVFSPSVLIATTFGVMAAGLEAQTGWSHSAVTYGSTIMSVVILLSSPVAGFLTDRYGGRRIVLVFTPLFAISLLGLNFATQGIYAFYLCCFCLSLTALGLWPLSYMKVLAGWFEKRLGMALGVATTGVGVGTALMPMFLGSSFKAIGWAATYTALAIVILIVLWPLTLRLLHEPADHRPNAAGSTPQAGLSREALRHALRSRAFKVGLVTFFALGIINSAILVHGIAVLKWTGMSLEGALKAQALVGLGAIAGRLGTGWLLDRLSVRLVGGVVFALGALNFLILSSEMSRPLAAMAAAFGGFVIGGEFDILGVLIRRHLGTEVFGRIYGFIFGGFHLGGAVGSASLAYLLTRTGSFQTALEVLLAMSVGCAWLFSLVGNDPVRSKS